MSIVEVITTEVTYEVSSGVPGPGVPTGGTTGQTLKKSSGTNYETEWSSAGSGSVTGVLATTPIVSDGNSATPRITHATTLGGNATTSFPTSIGTNTFGHVTSISGVDAAGMRSAIGLKSAAVLDVGTTASKVVQMTAAAKLPGVDGSLVTDLNMGEASTGTLAVARGGTGLTSVSTLLNSNTTKSDVGLAAVENTALTTWGGSGNITAVGTISSGVWGGTAIAYSALSGKPSLGTASQFNAGIGSDNILQANAAVSDNDFLTINGTKVEGRSASETLSDIGAQAALTFGIANNNAVKINAADVANGEFAKFTASGLTSRSAVGVLSDIGAQAVDADLTAIAGLTSAANKGIQFTGSGSAAVYDLTAAGKALLDDADAAAQRTTLELGTAALVATGTGDANAILGNDARLTDDRDPTDHSADKVTSGTLGVDRIPSLSTDKLTSGTLPVGRGGTGLTSVSTLLNSNTTKSDVGLGNVTNIVAQPVDADLTAIAGLTSAANKGIQFTGSGSAGVYDLTAAGKALLDDADAAAQRTTLGVTNVGSYTGQIETAADKTYTLDPGAATARTISGFYIKSASGTVTATLKVGTAVVKAASVTSSTGDQSSLANTSVSANDVLTLVCSSNSSALDVIFSVEYTE